MQAALRPYATAGVALVGASVIAVSPVIATPTSVEGAGNAAVHLSALVNPIGAFEPVLQKALADVQALGQSLAADPAPILEQIIRNQATNIANLPAGIQAQIAAVPHLPELLAQAIQHQIGGVQSLGNVSEAFLQTFIGLFTGGALQKQFADIAQEAQDGDFGAAFNALLVLTPLLLVAGDQLQNLALLTPIVEALQQPLADAAAIFPIAAGPLNNAQAAIGQLPNVALFTVLGALSPVSSISIAAGNTLGGLINAARNGDPQEAITTIITEAVNATDSIVTNAIDPVGGVIPTLVALRQAIAAAITTPVATTQVAQLPPSAAHTFKLTAPLEAPALAKAPTSEDADATSTPTTSGTDASGSAKDVELKDDAANAKGGNLFTPGAASTKGGRHRADTGSFAQGVRDTIKGLTGLGREKNSESSSTTSKSGESASSSSSSGSTGSGGGSGK